MSRDPEDRTDRRHGRMTRIGELLPQAARELGLEEELDLATAMTAWQQLIAERVPAAAGASRLVGLSQGVATIEADEPIVAQEIRLRSPELLAGLRSSMRAPIRQLRVTLRHV
jgi:predicted nucleic acid-binding Zn ribbon protein